MSLFISSPISTGIPTLSRVPLFPQKKQHRQYAIAKLKCSAYNNSVGTHQPLGSNRNHSRGDEKKLKCIWEETEYVEVFGIGSRKDAVLEFCLGSPNLSASLRFWNIVANDSVKVQLEQRLQDTTTRIVEAPLELQSCSKAVILVVSAAYGLDHTSALEILNAIKSANGLVVGIILKPFSFEGQRRQDEVLDLVRKLDKHANFCIVVDTDALLEKDLVTLDEALRTSNNAVLMAINAISVLISEKHLKLLDVPDNGNKELKVQEIQRVLQSYKEAKIGFGMGYNIKTSILRAIYDCPFFGVSVKDFNGLILCTVTSSGIIEGGNIQNILDTFRRTTECKGDVLVSIIHDRNLDSDLIVTTIVAFSSEGEQSSQRDNIFSRLARQFPFIFNILQNKNSQLPYTQEDQVKISKFSNVINTQDLVELSDIVLSDGETEDIGSYSGELQTLLSNGGEQIYTFRDYNSDPKQKDVKFFEADPYLTGEQHGTGPPIFKRDLLARRTRRPDYQIMQQIEKEGEEEDDDDRYSASILDSVSIFNLPVGVKFPEQLKERPFTSETKHQTEWTGKDVKWASPGASSSRSEKESGYKGSEAVENFYRNASKSKQRSSSKDAKKVLSSRAASMLEAERDSHKKWTPAVEMRYRGGVYRGRIQGGLPEGKGHLSLRDGSAYDGMWRYGKRSGPGTFYFSNGDVLQGSWRDDAMHGKGWLYFHTGDRMFMNFWKGKANGEGRFYSKLGDVYFGHFKCGWRHGHFLCINVDGTRCHEVWDEGVLMSRKVLGSDSEGE